MEVLSGDLQAGDVLVIEDSRPADKAGGNGGGRSSFRVRMF